MGLERNVEGWRQDGLSLVVEAFSIKFAGFHGDRRDQGCECKHESYDSQIKISLCYCQDEESSRTAAMVEKSDLNMEDLIFKTSDGLKSHILTKVIKFA